MASITSLPAPAVTNTTNNSYTGVTCLTSTILPFFDGPMNAGVTCSVKVAAIGKQVTLEFPTVSVAAANIVAVSGATAYLGTSLLPQATIYQPVMIKSNSAFLPALGVCEINTAGDINIYATATLAGTWLATGNCGWNRFSVSFITA